MRVVSRVILFVYDIEKMTEFYRQVIGLPVTGGAGTGFVTLSAGSCELALHELPENYRFEADGTEREDSYIKLVFYSDDVDADRAVLEERGVRMRKPVSFDQIILCDGLDPEGNIFQLSSRPVTLGVE